MSKVRDNSAEPHTAVDETYLKSDAQELVAEVKEVATKVYAALGSGHRESVYRQAMAIEFRRRSISYQTEAQTEILYEEERVGLAELDFIVDDRLVVELKRVDSVGVRDEAQTKAYMRTLGIWNGIVVNFPPHVEPKPQIKQVVNDSVSPVEKRVPAKSLQHVKPYYEKYAIPISQRMKKAVEEIASVWAESRSAEAEYDAMLSQAREFGFSEDEIEASESLNWRRVKPARGRG